MYTARVDQIVFFLSESSTREEPGVLFSVAVSSDRTEFLASSRRVSPLQPEKGKLGSKLSLGTDNDTRNRTESPRSVSCNSK